MNPTGIDMPIDISSLSAPGPPLRFSANEKTRIVAGLS
jgi:hypothetical protein